VDRGPKTPLINNKTVMDGSPEQCAAGKKGNRKMMGGPPVYQDFGDILGVMPIFGRRQLQRMLDELGPWLTVGKAKDLLKRLDSREPNQALPAEYELGITWAVSKIAMLEIDRSMGNRTPDIYSPDLLKGGPLFADVAAIDDVSLSGIATMRRARNIINSTCSEIRKGSAEHLHYRFGEESGYAPSPKAKGKSKRYRRRLVSRSFVMDTHFRNALKAWLAVNEPSQPLDWKASDIAVSIQWRPFSHPFANIFCTMPSLALDVQDNPLYRVLYSKYKQLKDVPYGCSRAIFLGNAGCRLLDSLELTRRGFDTFGGGQIIQSFLADYPSIDFVLVFPVERLHSHSFGGVNNPRVWTSHLFTHRKTFPAIDAKKLNSITEQIPAPYLSGYEAHSWHEQGMCNPNGRGHYVSSKRTYGPAGSTIWVSARAVQELIGGRLTPEAFTNALFGKHNPFQQELSGGRMVSNVRFESQGVEHDDDYIVFEFKPDFAASPLQLPYKLKAKD